MARRQLPAHRAPNQAKSRSPLTRNHTSPRPLNQILSWGLAWLISSGNRGESRSLSKKPWLSAHCKKFNKNRHSRSGGTKKVDGHKKKRPGVKPEVKSRTLSLVNVDEEVEGEARADRMNLPNYRLKALHTIGMGGHHGKAKAFGESSMHIGLVLLRQR